MAKKRRLTKAERIRAASTRKRLKRWREDEACIVAANKLQPGDQHAKCEFCGRTYLITAELLHGVGCAVCLDVVNKLPFGAKFILNSVIYRLNAIETLRTVDETEIQALKDRLDRGGDRVRLLGLTLTAAEQKFVENAKAAWNKKLRRK